MLSGETIRKRIEEVGGKCLQARRRKSSPNADYLWQVKVDWGCGHTPKWQYLCSVNHQKRCSACAFEAQMLPEKTMRDFVELQNIKFVSSYRFQNSWFIVVDYGCKHGEQDIRWQTFKAGSRCKHCAFERNTLHLPNIRKQVMA